MHRGFLLIAVVFGLVFASCGRPEESLDALDREVKWEPASALSILLRDSARLVTDADSEALYTLLLAEASNATGSEGCVTDGEINRAVRVLDRTYDNSHRARIRLVSGDMNLRNGRYAPALYDYLTARHLDHDGRQHLAGKACLGLASCYTALHEPDSVRRYCRLALGYLSYPGDSLLRRQSDSLMAVADTVAADNRFIADNIIAPVYTVFNSTVSGERFDRAHERLFLISVVAILIAIMTAAAVAYGVKLMSMRADIETSIASARDLESALSDRDREIDVMADEHAGLKRDMKALLSAEFTTIDRLCETYFQYQGTAREKTKLHEEVLNTIVSMTESDERFESIVNRINRHTSGLISRLSEEVPSLRDWEIQLFVFIVLDLSPRTISVFQKITPQIVYGRKSALKRKIRESGAPSTMEFLGYL